MARVSKKDAQRQPMISTFFSQQSSPLKSQSKRANSPIDLTLDDEPPAKRKKDTTSNFFSSERDVPAGPSRVPDRPTGAAEKWRFSPNDPRTETTKQYGRDREALKKRLLGDNNPFLRRAMSERSSDAENSERSDDSDSGFKDIMDMFSRKTKGKGNKAAKRKVQTGVVSRGKKREEVGPSGQTYTPLEAQVVDLKKKYPSTLLMVEVGYKHRFFGEDAQIAAKELGIICFTDRNFLTASIPTHRRDVHLKKLLSQGYRVGIVEQTETAALKQVSENRNAPFDRKLAHLYTSATYIDELGSVDEMEQYAAPPLACLVEERRGVTDERVSIAMVVISPSTGDLVWDEFDDAPMRIELETRMAHTKPYELLLPDQGLSKPTEKMLAHFSEAAATGHKIRTERFKRSMSYTAAFTFLTEFYTDNDRSAAASESFNSGKLMAAVADFPRRVVIALAHTIKHLAEFGLVDAFLDTKFFIKFTTRSHMLLNGNTLANLEIYRNETDYTTKGSLIWILDHTKTKFGARMLKSWVGRPLVDMGVLRDRVDAIEEILSSPSEKLVTLRELLKKTPDLARGLCRIQYGKCTPQELALLLPAFNKIATAYPSFANPSNVGFKSKLLNDIVFSFPVLRDSISELLSAVSLKRAAEGRKDIMWTDPERYPVIADLDMGIQTVKIELKDELKSIRKILKKPTLEWTSVGGDEYVIEVKNSENRIIPDAWHRLPGTKSVKRYHTSFIKEKIQELARYREAVDIESKKAFSSFLAEIAQNYYAAMRDAVNKLAAADCLLSFALVALQEGYVRPQFTEDDTLEIVEGRHPMVEALRSDPFVPNTCKMGGTEPRSKIITGPNMGGKSSSVRMIALIVIMAQIGSYVPAASVKMGMLDGVLTRMGASDELSRGRSTFMVEMSETSEILHTATEKSLVILDELGRGTSTYDGMAIASAVLEHLVRNAKCKTLFITHYPSVATEVERKFPLDVQNLHMGFTEETRVDGNREITFLYRLTLGVASGSFGVECARLAGLPEAILSVAAGRSGVMKDEVEDRSKRNKIRKCVRLLNQCLSAPSEGRSIGIDQLRDTIRSLTASNSFGKI